MIESILKKFPIIRIVLEITFSDFTICISASATHPSGPDSKSKNQYLCPFAYNGPLVTVPLAPEGCEPTDGPPGAPNTLVSPLVLTEDPTGVSPGSKAPPEPLRNILSGTQPSGPEIKSTYQ